MADEKRGCENCGNYACANSVVAFNWGECVKSNFTKHWKPKGGGAESGAVKNEQC